MAIEARNTPMCHQIAWEMRSIIEGLPNADVLVNATEPANIHLWTSCALGAMLLWLILCAEKDNQR